MAGVAAPALARADVRQPPALAFAALRNGQRIGEQSMSFDYRGQDLTVVTSVEMAVKLGPIVLYRYRHHAIERWSGGHFSDIETQTDQDGRKVRVSARRVSSGVAIRPASGEPFVAPANALPFTHWNRAIARAPLFNPQSGKLLRERVAPPARSSVLLASGARIAATRVAFQGDADIDDWYDLSDVWAGLVGRLKDGSTMAYHRLAS